MSKVKNTLELEQILAGCLKNDRRCQNELYDRFYTYALKVALPYCASEMDAREVVNEAFLKVFTKLERYNSEFTFATWLRTIVVRTAINQYHSHQSKFVICDLRDGHGVPFEDNFLSQMDTEEVLLMIQQLPPAYRMTLNLYAIEGFSHLEIAEMLEVSVGTSKSNLFKARAKLKKLLIDYLPQKYG